jgi:DNA-binding response OmpR family regulator
MPGKKATKTKKGAKILVVEDEKALNDMYRMWLEAHDFEVVTADNGVTGIEKAIHEMPSLIVLDVLLPKKDGFEVLSELRGNPKTKKIPVIILSSLDQDFEQRQGLHLGAEKYLVKTNISPDILFETVSNLLK